MSSFAVSTRSLSLLLSGLFWSSVNGASATRWLDLDVLCPQGGIELRVHDAIAIHWKPYDLDTYSDDFDNSTISNETVRILPIPCKVIFNLPPENGAVLMVTLRNHLAINRDLCTAWNPLMRIWTDKQALGLGCVRETARFLDPPVTLAMNLFILHSLLSTRRETSFSVVVTAVTFDCSTPTDVDEQEWSISSNWWPCTVHEGYCIRRRLFCDKINNCGANEDEDRRLCTYWPSYGDKAIGSHESSYILQQILSKYDKAQESFSLTLFAPEVRDDEESKKGTDWQRAYIPVTASFFAILLLMMLGCVGYICWTRHRNQRLRRNFIDYAINHRRPTTTSGNRLGVLGFDSYPLTGAGNAFTVSTDEYVSAMEWAAENRSLLGRRR